MSLFKARKITGATGTELPNFTNGFNIAGADSGISGFTHHTNTDSDGDPTSPANGDTWWNSDTNTYKVYANGAWQTLIGTASTTADPTTFSFAYDTYLASDTVTGASSAVATQNIRFSADGTILHILGMNRDAVYYDLSTAWDISTATLDLNKSFSNTSATNDEPFDIVWDARSLDFNSNGTAILSTVHTASYHRLRGWNLNTAYDILSASSTTPAVDRTFTTTTLNNIWNGIKDTSHRLNFTSSGYDYRSKWIDSGNKFAWFQINTGGVGGKMLIFNVTTAYDPTAIDVTSSGALSCFDFGYEIVNNIDPTRYNTTGAHQNADFWFSDDGTKIWVDGRKDYTDAQSNTVTACDLFVFETSVAWDISKSNMTHVKTIRLGEDAVSPNWKLTERIRSFYVNESEQKVYIGLQELYPSASGSDVLSSSYGVAEFSYGSSSSSSSSGGGLTDYTGDRGVFTAGANNGVENHINYISISTIGNATDFGDMSVPVFKHNGGASDTSRGLFMGGRNSSNANVNDIQYITFATPGNSTDFGDIHAATYELCTTTNGTYGLYWGGANTGIENTIQYVTVATTGNSTNFGNMTEVNALCTPISGSTRNLRAGGDSVDSNVIDYVTVATPGNATDFGDLSVVAHSGESVTDDSRAVIALGREGVGNQVQDTMEYITVDTAGNTTDFGDLTVARHAMGATSSNGRGCFGGGGVSAYSNVIDYITIQTTGNATDFGDLVTAFGFGGSCSGAAS
jgi:hypothetical protein